MIASIRGLKGKTFGRVSGSRPLGDPSTKDQSLSSERQLVLGHNSHNYNWMALSSGGSHMLLQDVSSAAYR